MVSSYRNVVQTARRVFREGRTLPVEFRRQQLQQLKKMILENKSQFIDALRSDLGRPLFEAAGEVMGTVSSIEQTLGRLDDWVKTKEVKTVGTGDKSFIYNDPYGVVLVMGAWNFPLVLLSQPVAGAIAAGNTVVMKPSEVSATTAKVFETLAPKYLDSECYPVVCGGVPETTELLKERFDYIFYTGSTTVGKIVRDAANKHLTPTTLELGGKSPCYIDDTADMDKTVRRILKGKMTNLGQICIAPDYVLCNKQVQETFVQKAKEVLREWYGVDPSKSPDLSRIVAERHIDRLSTYLKEGKIAVGGRFDRSSKFVEPTILTDVSPDSKVMKEEIFGPILPILNVNNHNDVIDFVNDREKPLAMYVFSTREDDVQDILRRVSSGGVSVNDVMAHAGVTDLPFGGVGSSGMGAYHGDYTFETFTHRKSVLMRNFAEDTEAALKKRYPPYKL